MAYISLYPSATPFYVPDEQITLAATRGTYLEQYVPALVLDMLALAAEIAEENS